MSAALLQEYVKLALQEATRSRTFSYEVFETLPSISEKLAYCREHLQELGHGSARTVFLLSSGKVLKVAHDTYGGGKEQNHAEVEIASEPRMAPFVARIIDHDDKGFTWLVSELVRPVTSETELEKLLGIAEDWNSSLSLNVFMRFVRAQKMDQKRFVTKHPELAKEHLQRLAAALRFAIRSFELNIIDAGKTSSWGKTADGRAVLLDYGLVDNLEDYS